MPKMKLGGILLLVAIAVSALCLASDVKTPGPAQFRQDLQFFARELPLRHKNAFHFTTRGSFEAAVAALDSRLDQLDEDQFLVGMMRIGAMIGDAHTHVSSSVPPPLYPIILRDYGEGFRVPFVYPGYEKALGTRLVQIDETPSERFYPILSELVAQNENATLAPAMVVRYLRASPLVHGAGIAVKAESAHFTFRDDSGQQFTLDLPSLTPDQYQNVQPIPVTNINRFSEISEPLRNASPTFSYTYIASGRAVYADVRSMKDVHTPAQEFFKFVAQRHPDKLIVDLRQNPGGDYFHGLHGLIEPIIKLADINRKGHLFVLIGPLTGSAAIINASQFHTMTKAILVGEPIGAKPTEYSELKTMTLPNTKFTVGYSVRFYDFSFNKENVVVPDYAVGSTWDDVKNGRAPVIDWCLTYKAE